MPIPKYYHLIVAEVEGFQDPIAGAFLTHQLYFEVMPGNNLTTLLQQTPELVTEDLYGHIHRQIAGYVYSLSQIIPPSGKGGSLGFDHTGQGFDVQKDCMTGEGPFPTDDEFWAAHARRRLAQVRDGSENTDSTDDQSFLTLLCYNAPKRRQALREDGRTEQSEA